MLQSALLVGAFFMTSDSWGQGNILELLPGSETLEYNEQTGIHKLRGNVNFKYQGNIMYCDSAYYYQKQNAVRAYGRVHINKKDTLNMFCDSAYYNGKHRHAKLWGNVRVRDNEYKLTTDTLDYDAKAGQAFYRNGGRIQSIVSQEVITSRVGYFHPESKNFFFSHQVDYKGKDLKMKTDTLRYLYSQKTAFFFGPTNIELDKTTMYCESGWYNTGSEEGKLQKNAWIQRESNYISGDTLLYKPKLGESIGMGNVFMKDTTQKMSFNADYAFNSDSLKYSFLTGNAIATKEMKDDTLYIHADTLFTYKQDSSDIVRAYYGARIFSTKVQGTADSISYITDSNRVELFRDPIIWSKGSELKGDTMIVYMNDSIIRKVDVLRKATVLMEVAKDTMYNQIAGNLIEAFFKDNEIYLAKANGNAMTIFFPEEEEKRDSSVVKKRMGMNRLYSSVLKIYIDSNEITGITYLEEPDGVFYPIDKLNKSEQFVPGFRWMEALRPESKDDLILVEQEEAPKEKEEEEENEESEVKVIQNE